jgi:hypothetical protein
MSGEWVRRPGGDGLGHWLVGWRRDVGRTPVVPLLEVPDEYDALLIGDKLNRLGVRPAAEAIRADRFRREQEPF